MTDCPCPLCASPETLPFHRDARRPYLRCPQCALVFVPGAFHVDAATEKAQYDLHENALDDPRYRQFLARLAGPVLTRVPAGSRGLDVGCGPAPLLARMLEEGGITMRVFDPYYAPDETVWTLPPHDLVTASEVVEHFRDPAAAFARLFAAVRPGGVLAVMTRRLKATTPREFADWHYIRDPTHIAFYATETFEWIADRQRAVPEFIDDDVVVFTTDAAHNAPTPAIDRP